MSWRNPSPALPYEMRLEFGIAKPNRLVTLTGITDDSGPAVQSGYRTAKWEYGVLWLRAWRQQHGGRDPLLSRYGPGQRELRRLERERARRGEQRATVAVASTAGFAPGDRIRIG